MDQSQPPARGHLRFLLGTSTRTDILTTATPSSGVSLSWWKRISANQKSIGLSELKQIAARCGIVDLRQAVEKVTADCA